MTDLKKLGLQMVACVALVLSGVGVHVWLDHVTDKAATQRTAQLEDSLTSEHAKDLRDSTVAVVQTVRGDSLEQGARALGARLEAALHTPRARAPAAGTEPSSGETAGPIAETVAPFPDAALIDSTITTYDAALASRDSTIGMWQARGQLLATERDNALTLAAVYRKSQPSFLERHPAGVFGAGVIVGVLLHVVVGHK